MDEDLIRRRFQDAGLGLQFKDQPFVPLADAEIFQMDIENRGTDEEVVRLYIPDGVDVKVLDVDQDEQELVLLVQEPERTFRERVPLDREAGESEEELLQQIRKFYSDAEDVAVDGGMAYAKRRTSSEKRRFLVGHDERHYFISQLDQPVTTVRQAHEGLRPGVATRDGTKRQGEWFFVPLRADEVEDLLERMEEAPTTEPRTWRSRSRSDPEVQVRL